MTPAQHSATAEQSSRICRRGVGMSGKTSMKVLVMFVLSTLLSPDLDVLAAASTYSTRTSIIRPSQTTTSDHQNGMQPEIVADQAERHPLNRQKRISLDEEVEESGQQLQASKVHPEIIAEKAFDSQARGFSGGEHVRGYRDKKIYAISVTSQKQQLVDDGAIITELDQPVARHIKSSTAKLSSSKHISELVDRSNLEADNIVLPPAEFMLKSDEALHADNINAAHTKLKKHELWERKQHPQQSKIGGVDLVGSDAPDPFRSDTGHYHESAKRKQTNEDHESTRRFTVSPIAAQKDRILYDAIDRSPEGAGHINNDFHNKAQTDVEEVVLTEEREEDKKLIPDYNLGEPIKDWNRKRQAWAREHPEVKQEQLFIITGTQPLPCLNAEGDHLLLRCFKNKVDYSRIHGVGLFYNTALLDAHMPSFWAKLPVVRATMLAHPEVEWIWWLDADAIITDMEFSIPLHRYSAYNLVVHGWESLIFEKRSWLGLNAGSFLLRNCQWSLELLERWASMGPKAPMGDAYRDILSDFLPDRPRNPTDDQAALVFLLIKERQRWAGKLRVELDFFLSGYWLELMDGFEAIEQRYRAMEEQHAELWELLEREGAVGKEKLVAAVGRAREQHFSASGTSVQQRRAFITHFTGCQPCSGHHNTIYSTEQCRTGLLRALNYADDQVLRTLGFQHRALHLPDVLPLPISSPTTA